MQIALVLLAVGLLIFLAHLFSTLFERTRIPDVLPLVFLGMLIGPVLRLVTPENFGQVGNVFTTIALVIILFESGLGLRLRALKNSMLWGVRLSLFNFIGSAAVLSFLSYKFLGLSLTEGILLGTILGGTSSAVVVPLVEKLRLGEGSRAALILESTFTDVFCIIFTLGILRTLEVQHLEPGVMLGQIIASFLLACTLGALGAVFWGMILSRVRELENNIMTTPAFLLMIFATSELLGYSGAISALAFGIVLGNIQSFDKGIFKRFNLMEPLKLNVREKAFFSELVFLLKTFFFVYLGISIRFSEISIFIYSLGLTLALLLIRIPVVRFSFDKSVSQEEASLAAVIIPKGLAAAILAALPWQAGLLGGLIIQDTVYALVLFSIILSALLTFLVEQGIADKPYRLIFANFATEKAKEEKG